MESTSTKPRMKRSRRRFLIALAPILVGAVLGTAIFISAFLALRLPTIAVKCVLILATLLLITGWLSMELAIRDPEVKRTAELIAEIERERGNRKLL